MKMPTQTQIDRASETLSLACGKAYDQGADGLTLLIALLAVSVSAKDLFADELTEETKPVFLSLIRQAVAAFADTHALMPRQITFAIEDAYDDVAERDKMGLLHLPAYEAMINEAEKG